MFARHVIPLKLMSDGGTQYSSSEFADFAQQWGFEHVTSSPYHPHSNGLAERTVQTVKNILSKTLHSNQDPLLAILEYRNTPIDDIGSLTELLMSRKLSSLLPTTQKKLRPTLQPQQVTQARMLRRQKKQKQYYDRRTKPLKDIRHGERVRILQQHKWQPAIVKEKMDSPCSFILETPGGSQYSHNQSHILKSNESAQVEKNG